MTAYGTILDFNNTTKDTDITIPIGTTDTINFDITFRNNGSMIADIAGFGLKVSCTRADSFSYDISAIKVDLDTIQIPLKGSMLTIAGKILMNIILLNADGTTAYSGIVTATVSGTQVYGVPKVPTDVGYSVIQDLSDRIKNLYSQDFTTNIKITPDNVIIACYNAPSPIKNRAYYVLKDERSMDIDINNIIEVTGSKSFSFTEGDIRMESPIILHNNMNIRGQGFATCFRPLWGIKGFIRESVESTLYRCNFENFRIEGDRQRESNTGCIGMYLACQECNFDHMWFTDCMVGLDTNAEGGISVMNTLTHCYFSDNTKQGVKLGTDSNMTQCFIGANSLPSRDDDNWDGCGIFLAGWGSRMIGCHFFKNRIHIRSDWSSFNTIQGCQFEAGYREDILLNGRSWNMLITGNMFGGKDPNAPNALELTQYDSIRYEDISTDGAYRNKISDNHFAMNTDRQSAKYNYIIEETDRCDYNMYSNNMFTQNYKQAQPMVIVGAHSQSIGNMN